MLDGGLTIVGLLKALVVAILHDMIRHPIPVSPSITTEEEWLAYAFYKLRKASNVNVCPADDDTNTLAP